MLPSHFFANLSRMRLIYRWPLMRNIQPENIAEHSLQVAMVAHASASSATGCSAAMSMPIAPPSWPSTTTAARC